jgi:hypothetical protein
MWIDRSRGASGPQLAFVRAAGLAVVVDFVVGVAALAVLVGAVFELAPATGELVAPVVVAAEVVGAVVLAVVAAAAAVGVAAGAGSADELDAGAAVLVAGTTALIAIPAPTAVATPMLSDAARARPRGAAWGRRRR